MYFRLGKYVRWIIPTVENGGNLLGKEDKLAHFPARHLASIYGGNRGAFSRKMTADFSTNRRHIHDC